MSDAANLGDQMSHLRLAAPLRPRPRFEPFQSYLDILRDKRAVNFERATQITRDFASDDACPICYERFEIKLPTRKTVCGHTYCQDCIARWLAHNVRCPTCNHHLAS